MGLQRDNGVRRRQRVTEARDPFAIVMAFFCSMGRTTCYLVTFYHGTKAEVVLFVVQNEKWGKLPLKREKDFLKAELIFLAFYMVSFCFGPESIHKKKNKISKKYFSYVRYVVSSESSFQGH